MTARRAALLALSIATPTPTAPAAAQDGRATVVFERTGYRLTSLGARRSVSARVLDARRRAVPNAPIAYRSENPDIAVVSSQGVVQSKRVGRTRVWAVSGRDSASALIVVDQWATRFAFSPSPVSFDAIGASVPLQVQLRDSAGQAIPEVRRHSTLCRSRDDRIAALTPTGQVQSKANGVTWVRCTDRGISDSVRVEVRQRPARAVIMDKLQVGTRAIPDTFRLRFRALDPRGDTIADARATWASLTPGMVTVDPVSGLARAVGPGQARIVAQVGDATDTITVAITGTAVASADAADAAAAAEAAERQPKLELVNLSPFVGDTVKVTFTARDALGSLIPNPERNVALRSSDSSIVVISEHRIVIKNSVPAYVVARFSDAGTTITDSILVIPRERGAAGPTTTADAGSGKPFERPVRDTAGARVRNARQIDSVLRALREGGIGRSTSGRTVGFEFVAAQARHATRLSSTVSESRSGLLLGGAASVAPFRKLVLGGTFRSGTLAVDANTLGEDLKVTEVDARLALWPAQWFGIGGGYLIRGESTDLSVVRWTAVSAGVMARGTFVGGAVSTAASFSIFPSAQFTGKTDKPEITSMAGDVGVDIRVNVFTAGFRYYFERFSFPATAGTTDQRVDQFSTLRLRLGLSFGR